MKQASVLLIDSDPFSAQALLEDLRAHGFPDAVQVAAGLEVPAACARAQPDVVLFNHHFDRPDDLLGCYAARLAAPQAPVVAIGSAGPGIKFLRQWNGANGYLHTIVEKPLQPGRLLAAVRELLQRQQAERALQQRAERLERLVPQGALQTLAGDGAQEEEMFEAAVVFTDIRSSSQMITSQPARAFFRVLNESLSAQAAQVRAGDGAVVKYTGDGLMAVFRGMGRSHLALRCAMALSAPALQDPLAFGVGVAEGLVLAGMVGDHGASGQLRQYDVIGATVHLAARLCALAAPGQVLATRDVLRASRIPAGVEELGPLQVRGFASAIDCVALRSAAAPFQPA